jgi:CheY-like chemotaxis protein
MSARRRPRALVVDDHVDAREIALALVREVGCEATEASDGIDALKKLESLTPDVILIDFAMPVLNGVELTRRLRQDPRSRHACIIMLTAYLDEALKLRALTAGCDAILSKPYDSRELKRIVSTYLRQPAF